MIFEANKKHTWNLGMNITGDNGKELASFTKGLVSIFIPYELKGDEKVENMRICNIDNEGNLSEVARYSYDKKNKTISFNTDHLSKIGLAHIEDNRPIKTFIDIGDHWAKKDIEFVSGRDLFSGTGDNKFSPNMPMTRGMFVTVLGRLAGVDKSNYKETSFTDVGGDSYYGSYVEWANKEAIVKGMGDNKFAPDTNISREQMALIIANYAQASGLDLAKVQEEKNFADKEEISSYGRAAVAQMQMAGLISGKDKNKFDPKGPATRAEVSSVLRGFIDLLEKK